MNSSFPSRIGTLISNLRLSKGWTQADLFEKSHVPIRTIQRIERGKVKRPQTRNLQDLATALEIDVGVLEEVCQAGKASDTGQASKSSPDNDTIATSIPNNPSEPTVFFHKEPILVNDTGIPRLFTHFVGRGDLLEKLKDQLCSGKITRPIALYGKPGVGKTAIAMAIANDPTMQQYFHGRILWAGLGIKPDIEGILHRWNTLLYMQDTEAEIGSQPLLLILDDVWDINDVAKFFQLGCYNPSCRYLITTVSQSLADMISDNDSFEVPELDEEKALELLQHLAPNVAQAEKKEALTLVREVGGLPLAIWLMGTYLRREANHKQPNRIRDALKELHSYEKRLQLKGVPHDLKEYPNLEKGSSTITLDAVIGVRYDALNVSSQKMLRNLSIFPAKPNTFSEDAASAVAATTGKVFRDQLVDAGLVEDVSGDRYTLHQTVRDFAFSKLGKEQDENKVADERFAHFFADFVKTHEIQTFDETNIDQALQWAHDQGQNELYLALESGMQYFWRDHWRVAESMEHLYIGFLTATATYKETNDTQSLQNMMEVACNYGSTLIVANNLGDAQQVFETILGIAGGDTLDRLSEGIALFNLGIIALQLGNLDEARNRLEASRSIRYKEQYLDEWALDYVTFCRIAHSRNQLEMLKDHFERAIEIDRAVENRRGEGVDLFSLGNIAFIQQKYEVAVSKYRECLVIIDEFQEKIREGTAPSRWRETILLAKGIVLGQLCEMSLFLGKLDIAKDYLQHSIKIIQELQHRRQYVWDILYSGHLALVSEQKEDANRYYLEALIAAQEVQDQQSLAEALYNLAILAELDRNLDQAEDFHWKSLKLYKVVESAPYVANSLLRLGRLLLEQNKNREEGCSMISEAIQWYSSMDIKYDEITQEIAKKFQLMCSGSET